MLVITCLKAKEPGCRVVLFWLQVSGPPPHPRSVSAPYPNRNLCKVHRHKTDIRGHLFLESFTRKSCSYTGYSIQELPEKTKRTMVRARKRGFAPPFSCVALLQKGLP